ncbi:MAG TPA: ABC transporter substrate-binding protein [Acidimicrobiia bacterium]|jgi:branched-chain amino acid transport system substrate-binding protein|nr:ABC transporter substrate-binding protein [Acidimicrobiia bacterium]
MVQQRRTGLRAAAGAAVVVVTVGALALAAGAQASSTSPGNAPGVTDNRVTLGFIGSQSGVAAPTQQDSDKACQARVDAENAKGGVNGRKINLEVVDDKSSGANLTAARDLVENRNAFAVVDNSAFAFLTYRYLKDAGVPMIGGGFDGSYYYDQGNENIVSGLGGGTPVPGLAYDTPTKVMKQLGAKKIAALGYGVSPSSSEAAKATETYAAKAQGLKGVYLNNTVDFGSTDVGPLVLGIKNSGADGLYLPLDNNTNFAIVQSLVQNNVPMKANVMATGYGQTLLDQTAVTQVLTQHDVFQTGYRPVELGGAAIKTFRSNLKKYSGITGVPGYGVYTGYIVCDMAIHGLKNAGENPTRQGFVDGIRKANGGIYDAAGLTCSPLDLSYGNFGKVDKTSCLWFATVKDDKFHVLNGGKPFTGKLVGDPALVQKYESSSGNGVATTTSAAPST